MEVNSLRLSSTLPVTTQMFRLHSFSLLFLTNSYHCCSVWTTFFFESNISLAYMPLCSSHLNGFWKPIIYVYVFDESFVCFLRWQVEWQNLSTLRQVVTLETMWKGTNSSKLWRRVPKTELWWLQLFLWVTSQQHFSLPSRLAPIRSMIARFLGQVQRRHGKGDGQRSCYGSCLRNHWLVISYC